MYGILYLCFVAYPIVFARNRGWGPGISGLAFIGIGIGTMIGICGEPFWRKLINMHPKDPSTGKAPPEATARVMIIGGILAPIGQLGFSWTCLPETIHWAVPIAFGIPFGCGNALSFIYGVRPHGGYTQRSPLCLMYIPTLELSLEAYSNKIKSHDGLGVTSLTGAIT